ncbi:Hypothetical_protein [Hexamita inflata]|uniref:Hypothetical_protein n=1 Tax=Hexamita inflata TaxID=28002 RepID=A0AA86PWM2_9EUKA|nr:Hypothetical protein HINF_LOCUS35254 [Hexamita inflata]CAI9972453.1 Hypothetical protein HINF_LOCUS60098 [Hexamita inflata]
MKRRQKISNAMHVKNQITFQTFSRYLFNGDQIIKQLVSYSHTPFSCYQSNLVSEISTKSLTYQAFGSIKTHCQYSQVIVLFLVMPFYNDWWTNNSRWVAYVLRRSNNIESVRGNIFFKRGTILEVCVVRIQVVNEVIFMFLTEHSIAMFAFVNKVLGTSVNDIDEILFSQSICL